MVTDNDAATLALLEARAAAGHTDAAYALGTAYMLGRGVRSDRTLALHWYEKAHTHGHSSAAARIAAITGVRPADVVETLTAPAAAADADSLFRQAQQLEVGFQVEQDMTRAIALYNEAADLGHGQAQYALGMLTLGTRSDKAGVADAFRLLRMAALQEVPEAQYELGRLHAAGKGTTRNMAVAKAWYRKAAAHGHIGARRIMEARPWWRFW